MTRLQRAWAKIDNQESLLKRKSHRVAITYNLNRGELPEELEFDLPTTIDALDKALGSISEVCRVECHRDILYWLSSLLSFSPDIIFNVAEGYMSAAREAFFPALFEQIGFLYCGNDPTTLLITHNKGLTNQIVETAGLNVPKWVTAPLEEDLRKEKLKKIKYPILVKPNSEGSSLGLNGNAIVTDPASAEARIQYIWNRFDSNALLQAYIADGTDVSVTFIEGLGQDGIFGPVVYAYSDRPFLDSALKSGITPQTILRYPAKTLPEEAIDTLRIHMRKAVHSLDMRGYARADFRVGRDGCCWFLEMNGQGEFKPERSDLLLPLFQEGHAYEEIIQHIVTYGLRKGKRLPSRAGLRWWS